MQSTNFFLRFWEMARRSKRVFLARTTPRSVKIILLLGLLYCLSPLDLIPEWVPVLGLMDDLALAALLIAWASGFELPEEQTESGQTGDEARHS